MRCRRAGGIRWTCTANGAGAADGSATGTGNIDALVTLPVGTTSDLHGERDGAGGHQRSADQHGDRDPAGGGDRSGAWQWLCDDTKPANPQADLAITKVSSPNPYVPGALLSYTMV
jgi:hypothetical protein